MLTISVIQTTHFPQLPLRSLALDPLHYQLSQNQPDRVFPLDNDLQGDTHGAILHQLRNKDRLTVS